MDEASYRSEHQDWGKPWDRSLHAKLLDRLRADKSGPVIFDVGFADEGDPEKNAKFAKAIADHGQVVLGGDVTPMSQPGMGGRQANPPLEPFRKAGAKWGITDLDEEARDGVVRRHYPGTETDPPLAWVAATMLKAAITADDGARSDDRWIRYYGCSNVVESLSYYSVFDRAPGYFKNKVVLIGGKPKTRHLGEEIEQIRTPYSFWTGESMSGVELHAILLLNLLRDDWLIRCSRAAELVAIVLLSAVIGFGLRLMKPIRGAVFGLAIVLLISAIGILSALYKGAWFPWATLAGLVVPAAWLSSLAAYKQETLTSQSETEYEEPPPAPLPDGEQPPVQIPDYALLKLIGRGAYGEVWLGRNRVGIYHAVKIVYRRRFGEASPYEREFRGIRRYMPVSLRHAGLVKILYVGRNDQAGYFHYVMELGDDEEDGANVEPEKYTPRNLAKDLHKRGHLSVAECVALGIALSEPLEFLHDRGLMHRDIKPANIIFVDGIPKLADIGLVAEFARTSTDASYIGTEGYMAPEGPSKPTSDIYSFGKVLYEACMGLDRRQFPALPDWMTNHHELAALMALNSLILKCCDNNPRRRFQSAADLHKALLDLECRLRAK